MPRRQVSWLSTVPWVGGGDEAALGRWGEALLGCASAVGNIASELISLERNF
jgi:hypothetical protein